MPIATIDDEGTYLYYEDSGVPPGSSDYTTVICLHAFGVHGGMTQAICHCLRLL